MVLSAFSRSHEEQEILVAGYSLVEFDATRKQAQPAIPVPAHRVLTPEHNLFVFVEPAETRHDAIGQDREIALLPNMECRDIGDHAAQALPRIEHGLQDRKSAGSGKREDVRV